MEVDQGHRVRAASALSREEGTRSGIREKTSTPPVGHCPDDCATPIPLTCIDEIIEPGSHLGREVFQTADPEGRPARHAGYHSHRRTPDRNRRQPYRGHIPGPITRGSIGTRTTDQTHRLLATLYRRWSSEHSPGLAAIGASPATSNATRNPPPPSFVSQ